jgi:gluconokinase
MPQQEYDTDQQPANSQCQRGDVAGAGLIAETLPSPAGTTAGPRTHHALFEQTMPLSDAAPAPPPLTALIVMGVSGCGKSTIAALIAQRLGWPMIEGDDLHPPANIAKMTQGVPLSDDDRRPWLEAIAGRIDAWRQAGQQGVVTCSSLRHAYRAILRAGHEDVRFVFLKGSYDLLLARVQKRERHFMPASLLQSQFATLEEPGADEAIIVPIDQPAAGIVADTLVQLHLR